jgi:GMP synthase (glutamine-hydrolysing)
MRGKVLLIVHQRHSDPGRVGMLFMEHGYALDIRCPMIGQKLPANLDDYAACVVFGGPMSANDTHLPGIRAELEWLPAAMDSGKPLVGICLGAQMMTRVLGGKVGEHPDGLVEIGYAQVRPTEHGRNYFDGPMHVYQWHREGCHLPRCCTLLAAGDVFEAQAFRYGDRVYGIQFHPEVTLDMKRRWTSGAAHRLVMPGAQPAEEHLNGHALHDPPLEKWTRRFLNGLMGRVMDQADRAAEAIPPPASVAA